ncbi:arginine deiminase-related protein [Paraburkholderia caffeinilytica]
MFADDWFSTHKSCRIVLDPMKSINRRRERRPDVVERWRADR